MGESVGDGVGDVAREVVLDVGGGALDVGGGVDVGEVRSASQAAAMQ